MSKVRSSMDVRIRLPDISDMNRCCGCGDVIEPKDRPAAVGHVFECTHFLCIKCLGTFGGTTLRKVCFTCCTPPPLANDAPRSPFDNATKDSNNDGGKVKANNTGCIVGEFFPTKSPSVPAELIYDRIQLEITDVSLSGGRTEAVGHSMRMEKGPPRSPRKSSSDRSPRKFSSDRSTRKFADFALSLREKKKELEAAENSFTEQGIRIRNEIEKHAQKCRALIERDEKILLQQLDATMNGIVSENTATISSIWSLIQRLEKADEREEMDGTDEVEQMMTTRINTTQFKDIGVYLNVISPPDDRNIVGELKVDPIPDHSSFLSIPVLVGSIPGQTAVTGVTALDREIFITRDGSQDISVHSVMTSTHLRSLSLLHLLEPIVIPTPVDLAACRTTRTLYVADESNKYVYRLRTDGKLVHWWTVDNLRGLSVTTTGTVLVGSGRAIREYDPNGKLVRTISTSPLGSLFRGRERPSTKHPAHFLETDNGRIVVCDFPADASRGGLHVVYDVDRRGSAVACWHGNRADSGGEFLNEPRHLAIDVTGHVMVVDRRNDRVKLLDAELKFVRDLMGSGQWFKRPQRLHYDPARGLLYVGLVAGDTLVFRVTL